MFDLARVDSRALDVVSAVVDEITRVTSIDPSNILLPEQWPAIPFTPHWDTTSC